MAHSIDVLLPVFNGASTIGEAVASLQRQTIASFRILIIDDGSTDETPDLLAKLSRLDERVTVLKKSNSGIVDALNVGLKACQAEFVARQDADDISDPSRFSVQLDYLARHPDCVAVSGAARHIDENGHFSGLQAFFPPTERANFNWAASRDPYLLHPFLMVRRSALETVGGYRHVFHSEDTDLYWRLREHGDLHNIDQVVGDYRMHPRSVSGRSIINARIMALNSQLASISARRRHTGRPDLTFAREAIREYESAETLPEIFRLGSRQLEELERDFLRTAVAAKLLELTAYRPYELEPDDCRFIRRAFEASKGLSAANLHELGRLQAGAAARLLRKRLFRSAIALTPPSLYLPALARVATAALPRSLIDLFLAFRERATLLL